MGAELPRTEDDGALLRRFEPVVRFTKGERFYPIDVEPYVKLVDGYLNLLMTESGYTSFDKEAANVILREYNGQQEVEHKAIEHEDIYQEVVWEVFRLYQNSFTDSIR